MSIDIAVPERVNGDDLFELRAPVSVARERAVRLMANRLGDHG